MARRFEAAVAAAVLIMGAARGAHATAACARLVGRPVAPGVGVEIGSATARPRQDAARPAHCEIYGAMQRRTGAQGQVYAIRFHLRLPERWNGGLVFQGGGGSDGEVGSALGPLLGGVTETALQRGYAVVSDDAGHDNARNDDPQRQGIASFGWDPQARRNYGYAAIGPVARAAKTLVRSFYGRAPRRTFFVGGSKGGQEGLMAAERFPDLFEGVLVGYPGLRLAFAGAVGQMWDAQAFASVARAAGALDAAGLPLIGRAFSDSDLGLVARAALDACDALDGAADGMIADFTACTSVRVAPSLARVACSGAKAVGCLSTDQIRALRRVFDGARGAHGEALYSDWPWDAGVATAGWRRWKLGDDAAQQNTSLAILLGGSTASAVFTSPPTAVAADPVALTHYALGVDVDANARAVGARWEAAGESAAAMMNADTPDLSRFAARGGKLIVFHGVSDPVFSINDTVRWWRAVDRHEQGRAARFVRLFAVPGMTHGGGGPSTDRFDAFAALEAWVERGRAPTRLIATAGPATPWPGRTRPLCPYPQQPRPNGPLTRATLETASSFHCTRVAPE